MNAISFILIFVGLFFIASSITGIWKFSDFYTKIHVASLIESIGAPLILIGLMFKQDNFSDICKLFFIMCAIFFLGPLSTHAIAKSAIQNNTKPQKASFKRNDING